MPLCCQLCCSVSLLHSRIEIDRVSTINDAGGDGCGDSRELQLGLNPHGWCDFFDVPVPANPDMTPNGSKNGAISFGDVGEVVFYAVWPRLPGRAAMATLQAKGPTRTVSQIAVGPQSAASLRGRRFLASI